jgi:hypothetical protein
VSPDPGAAHSRRHLLPPLVALILVAAAWLSTLQVTIGAANDPHLHPSGLVDPLMDDSGEFVVAWHTWGVVHPPGYPLLAMIANPVAQGFHRLGLSAVTGASLVSFLCALAALAVLGWLVGRAGGSGWGPAAAILLGGLGVMTWLYASVAEAYALGLLLGLGLLAVAVYVGEAPSRRGALVLGLVAGLAVGHHRTLLALAPAVAFAAWPARRLGARVWLAAAGVAVASLAVYLYLPLAALAGSPWVYGRSPATWAGFWDAVLAREYGAQLAPPTAPAELAAALLGRLQFLAEEGGAWLLALGAFGIASALTVRQTRRVGVVLTVAFLGYLLAPVGQYLLIGTHMLVMLAAVTLAGLVGLAVTALGDNRRLGSRALLLFVASAAWLSFSVHRPAVLDYTRDPLGERIVAAAAALPDPAPTLVEAWGPRYFALAYGKYADGRLARAHLVDARSDLSGLPADATVYTTQDLLHLVPPDKWSARLGRPLALSSAGDGLVSIGAPRLLMSPPPAAYPQTTDGDVALVGARAWREGGDVRVRLEWQALRPPARDYSVFVKVLGADGATVLAQGDRDHPVYGFYPTKAWRAGYLVTDDFRVPLPPGAESTAVAVGLYTVGADGSFTDHLRQVVPVGAAPSD